MADEWTSATLGDICSFAAGSAFPQSEQGDALGKYPFIKVSDMNLPGNECFITVANNWIGEKTQARLRAKVHPEGATVFAKIGVALTYNRRRVLSQPTIIDNNMMAAIPDASRIHSLFLYYLLCTIDFNEVVVGTALPYLNISDLKRINVKLPCPKHQQAIACILGALDDKIELNRRMNLTLEAIARAIFKSWFVDFDPVRAKAAGRQPPGLVPHIAELFPDSFVNSELGKIPRGWKVAKLTDEFNLTMGQSPPGSTYNESGHGYPFFQGTKDFGHRFPAKRVYCTAPTRFAHAGDTLVSVRAPVGNLNMASEKCCIGRGLAALRHRSNSRSYTYYAMHFAKGLFLVFDAEGTVFGSISKKDLESISFVAPPTEVVSMFELIVFPIDEQISTNEREIKVLAALRDALLPKLISGEFRVPDAERIIGRCV